MQILKGFKSCVLRVRILRELQPGFLEVRIPKGIVSCGSLIAFRRFPPNAQGQRKADPSLRSGRQPRGWRLNAGTLRGQNVEKSGEEECGWLDCDENM